MSRRCGIASPAVAALLALAAGGCGRSPGGAAGASPNVILVVIDTLRADHLSLDGYARPTSPRLAEWAAKGTYFDRFYSHSAWTRPSVTTILTGLLPTSHGIVRSGDGLNPRVPYLPRELRSHGYDTAALVTNPQLHSSLGFALGFVHYDEEYPESLKPRDIRPADLTLAGAAGPVLAAARRRAAAMQSPFFLYIHLLEPHGPYTPPRPFAERFTDPAYRGPVTGGLDDFGFLQGGNASAADVAQFTALYDAEIAATDAELGGFLDWLAGEGLLAGTHLFVTADHGEELLEHGGTGHGGRLFEEQVRIPLLWVGPGVPAGRRVSTLAGLADFVPTVLRLAGLPARPPLETAGVDLARLLSDGAAARYADRGIFFEEPAPPGPPGSARLERRDRPLLRGLVRAGRKLIAGEMHPSATHCLRLHVYDLLADPGEHLPRTIECGAGAEETDVRVFDRYLAEQRELSSYGAPAASLDAETEARLRALGYL